MKARGSSRDEPGIARIEIDVPVAVADVADSLVRRILGHLGGSDDAPSRSGDARAEETIRARLAQRNRIGTSYTSRGAPV